MTTAIIITFCILILIAYLFDVSSAKTKIPSVILLLLLGWIVRQLTGFFEIKLPNFNSILPVLGTVGLILIVLEGSLELELNKSKIGLIKKSTLGSLIPLLALALFVAFGFHYFGNGGNSFKDNLVNAIPFCVISSSIAIPSVKNLISESKEFVIYESSLSDIFGVILFNFIALNTSFGFDSFGRFGLQFLIILIVSFIATIGLSLLLSKIGNHVKFVPIILLVILIYTIAKIYHLPALIFILIFGLFIGNLNQIKHLNIISRFHPNELILEVQKFKKLTEEGAFLIRSLFFLLFGFLLETSEILNTETLLWSLGIVVLIFSIRAIQLLLSRLPMIPLLFIAPRGLITILLFLSIAPDQNIPLVNTSLIIQVIVFTTLIMMVGMLMTKEKEKPAATVGDIAKEKVDMIEIQS